MLNEDTLILIQILKKLPALEVNHFVKHLDEGGIRQLCECFFNIIKNDLKLSTGAKKSLREALGGEDSRKNIKVIINSKKVIV